MSPMKEVVARFSVGLPLFFLPFAVLAAQSAIPAPIVSPVSLGGMLQVLLGLGLVLAAVAGSAWLLRRFSPGQIGAGGAVKVIGGVALGPKERLVLVEIGETWLVLGVAPGQVNTLHTLVKPERGAFTAEVSSGGGEHSFSTWLKQAMQGRKLGQ
ncbi:flagellar biosynthetic protein FliO [Sulfuricella sp.]|uniref:flagellar biosynthetic protein FliO n=1 Tax=Sulfuricella sp. TaxID=2099377 RepID=UPI002BF1973C|nr:flagellar biosynthetic protein FliO [Sulfuricella sp.]HUX63919.1 flagellar biosynthetic protein FliO [Sulfuricella sp.]